MDRVRAVFAALGRAVGWNVLLGALSGTVTGVAFAAGGPVSVVAFVPVLGFAVGLVYGVLAGLVHGVLQAPVVALRAPRPVLRAYATLVSTGLVAGLYLNGTGPADRPPVWFVVAMLGPYVALTPFVAAWGYAAASDAAAESAARRSGASSTSRVSGSASDSSRASSE